MTMIWPTGNADSRASPRYASVDLVRAWRRYPNAADHRQIEPRSANDVFVSAASVWEIATKSCLGELAGVEDIAACPSY